MKTISIIRDRGQLTIPDQLRKEIDWISPMSVVSISMENPNKIIITPHKKEMGNDIIWESIHKSRSIKGLTTQNAVDFLIEDRGSH